MEKYHYRFTEKRDAKRVHEYSQIVFLESQSVLLLPDFLLENLKSEDYSYLEKLLSNESFIGVLAFFNGKIIGFCDAWISKKNPLEISIGVTIHKKFRQKGIATELIQRILKECKRRKIKSVHLEAV